MTSRTDDTSAPDCRFSSTADGGLTVFLSGRLDMATTGPLLRRIAAALPKLPPTAMTVDMQAVTYMNDFGLLVVSTLKQQMQATHAPFDLVNVPPAVARMIAVYNIDGVASRPPVAKKRGPGFLERLGGSVIDTYHDALAMLAFVGEIILVMFWLVRHPGAVNREDTISYMQKTGVDALPIVGLISFLLGLIMAFMSSIQLKQFGANIYVASLVSLSMARELGPIMTAILVAGRSGSAFAAEIGTMRVNEEVDALYTMGFNPVLFLAVPKIFASVIVVPLLTLFSDFFAIIGGLIVGVGMLDLTIGGYIDQTIWTLSLFDVFWGVFKSAIFAFLIAWIGCLRGFRVQGGALAVGNATTSAVVSGIFMIILVDALLAILLTYW